MALVGKLVVQISDGTDAPPLISIDTNNTLKYQRLITYGEEAFDEDTISNGCFERRLHQKIMFTVIPAGLPKKIPQKSRRNPISFPDTVPAGFPKESPQDFRRNRHRIPKVVPAEFSMESSQESQQYCRRNHHSISDRTREGILTGFPKKCSECSRRKTRRIPEETSAGVSKELPQNSQSNSPRILKEIHEGFPKECLQNSRKNHCRIPEIFPAGLPKESPQCPQLKSEKLLKESSQDLRKNL
ncbi:uncharacterized protein LOC134219222 isoform X2 [Armigeres subalbatus]|uniref:uncharacterized protein LOC134219222 isoform X2 n=1 Tax=Armigeres subalbatus TaxID=124917 RepID=UPI002ED66228